MLTVVVVVTPLFYQRCGRGAFQGVGGEFTV
jgi:hypothetical protein